MASSSGKQSYQLRLESKLHQPAYHENTICGYSFYGLATTLERLASENRIQDGLDQIRRCIRARQDEMNRRQFPDAAHNRAVTTLTTLLHKYSNLTNLTLDELKALGISYSDANNRFFFTLYAQPLNLGGKKMRKRRIRKTFRKRKIVRKTIKKGKQ